MGTFRSLIECIQCNLPTNLTEFLHNFILFFNQNNQHGQECIRIELVAFGIVLFIDKILCDNENTTRKSKMRLPAMDTLRKIAVYTAVVGISGCVYLQIKATSTIGQSPYFRAAFKTLRADPSKIYTAQRSI